MNCPGCGRFMQRVIAFEVGESPDEGSAYYWYCQDEGQHTYTIDPIPAPEYDWLYWWVDVPTDEIEQARAEWPELGEEIDAMKRRYEERGNSKLRAPGPTMVRRAA